MPKRPLKLSIRIPEYTAPRNTWCKAIHRSLVERQRTSPVRYETTDRLEVALRLYFTDPRSTEIHDVDNRLKDCLVKLDVIVVDGSPAAIAARHGILDIPIVVGARQIR